MKIQLLRSFFLATLVAFAFSSCTIEEEFVFNEDFSGKFITRIGFQKSTEMAGPELGRKMIERFENDTAGWEKIIYQMDSIPGISNAFFKTETNTINFGYSFDHIDLIDMPLREVIRLDPRPMPIGLDQDLPKKRFELDGKKLLIKSRSSKPSKGDGKDEESAIPRMLDEMSDKIEFNLTFRFTNPIKKVKKGSFERSDDKKTLTTTYKRNQDPNAGKTTIVKF